MPEHLLVAYFEQPFEETMCTKV